MDKCIEIVQFADELKQKFGEVEIDPIKESDLIEIDKINGKPVYSLK